MRSILRWRRSLTFPQTHPSPTRRAQEMEAFEISKDVGQRPQQLRGAAEQQVGG